MYQVHLEANKLPLVQKIGATTTHDEWIHPDRTTDYHVFIYIVQGRMQVIEEDVEYVLKEGDMLFLCKGLHHWGTANRTVAGTRSIWIHFLGGTTRQSDESSIVSALQGRHPDPLFTTEDYRIDLPLPKHMTSLSPVPIEKMLHEIVSLYESKSPLRHVQLSVKTMELFLSLVQQSSERPHTGKSEALIQNLVHFLEQHSDRALDTQEIRKQFPYNYHYLATLFKQLIGTSISQYHEQLRIHRAAELLTSTTLNVSEVGRQAGFDSLYYFSRVFRKVMGESPSQYIKRVYRTP